MSSIIVKVICSIACGAGFGCWKESFGAAVFITLLVFITLASLDEYVEKV